MTSTIQNYGINLGLDLVPISKDPDNLGDLYRLYNAVKLLAYQIDSTTGTVTPPTGEWATLGVTGGVTIQNNAKIYVPFVDATTPGKLIALNSDGKAVLGVPGTVIGWSPASVAAGALGEVRLVGLHTAISGLTAGAVYYVSTWQPGRISAGPTGQEGTRMQAIGFGLSSTAMFFNPSYFAPKIRTLIGGEFPADQFSGLPSSGSFVRDMKLLTLE